MSSCFPSGQLFEVHGSKFKPHPVGNVGLTSVMGITHAMPLLGISKDPLMRIAPGILGCTWRHQPAPHSPSRCAAGQSSCSFWSGYIAAWWDIGRKIWGRCNTPGNRPGCWCGRTKPSIPGRSRSHNVHHRHTSPLVPTLYRHGTLVGGGQHPAIVKYFFADMRFFIGGVRRNSLNFRESLCHFVIHGRCRGYPLLPAHSRSYRRRHGPHRRTAAGASPS